MLEFCRRQATTRQGHIRIGLLLSILFIISMTFGLLVVGQPYAVYATGEKVADPYVVKVDGKEVAVVDGKDAADTVEVGLRMAYADTVDGQLNAEIQNEITAEKYDYTGGAHPVVMSAPEVVDYIVGLNASNKEPVVGVVTHETRTRTESVPYPTYTLDRQSMYKGEWMVDTYGEDGEKEITEDVTLVSGKVVDQDIIKEKTTKDVKAQIELRGVKEYVEPEPEPTYTATTTTQTTSYSAPAAQTTSYSAPAASTSSYSGSNSGVAGAYAMIGTPYVWGGTSTAGVDCSGLVNVVYGGARGRTTYSMIGSLQSSGDWKTSMSQLQPGDLVFPSYGHVGIYIGNGQMIHSPYPGSSVQVAPVYSFYGGGSYY